ncbi:MAG: OmpA family protein [Kofleriaceae bacterium]
MTQVSQLRRRFIASLSCSLLAVAACGGSAKPKTVAGGGERGGSTVATAPTPRTPTSSPSGTSDAGDGATYGPVLFAYDSVDLTAAARDTLSQIATAMAAKPSATLVIEGHTDEQGTDEYNLALGERRAQTIQDYLVRLGVDRSRLQTLTYGEARPAVSGTGEMAWAQNRRGEFSLTMR